MTSHAAVLFIHFSFFSLPLFSSMRLESFLKNAITLPLMCNTFQISFLLAERIETDYSFPASSAHFYLCGDEDTQLREAVLGDATADFLSLHPNQILPSSSLFCDQRQSLSLGRPFRTFNER